MAGTALVVLRCLSPRMLQMEARVLLDITAPLAHLPLSLALEACIVDPLRLHLLPETAVLDIIAT